MTVMVFGKAMPHLEGIDERTVVGIAAPRTLPGKGVPYHHPRLHLHSRHHNHYCVQNQSASLSLNDASAVLVLGDAMDMGRCKGKRRDGKDCTMFVNVNESNYCRYHVSAAYKKASQVRMDCQHG